LIISALKDFSKREFADRVSAVLNGTGFGQCCIEGGHRAYYEELGFKSLFALRSDLIASFDSLAINPAVC
jgi:hypothetical protein